MAEKPLWPHQVEALARARLRPDLWIRHAPGIGKTRTTIERLKEIYNDGRRIQKTLILGPVIVCEQWKRAFLEYSKMPPERVVVLLGPGPRRLKTLADMRAKHPGGFVALSNYEALVQVKGFTDAITAWEPEILVLDESHRMKDSSTKRFKALRPIADETEHRYLLTGSPVLNSLLDVYAQMRLLDGGKSFMSYNPRTGKQEPMTYFQWRNHYFYDKNAGMPSHVHFADWAPRKGTLEHLQGVLAAVGVDADKSILGLPELIKTVIPVELGKDQRRAYDEMREMYITLVKDQAITASLAITQSLRLQQILSGFVQPSPDADPIFFAENPRFDMLMQKTESLVEQGEKVIIWTNFIPTYDYIAQGLKKINIDSRFLTGRESAKVKNQTVLDFAEPGGPSVVICHPQAVGLGVELTAAKSAIYYARSYSREHQIQTEARNHRGGSERHDCITHYDLVALETLDEVIANALADKASISETLLEWARRG